MDCCIERVMNLGDMEIYNHIKTPFFASIAGGRSVSPNISLKSIL